MWEKEKSSPSRRIYSAARHDERNLGFSHSRKTPRLARCRGVSFDRTFCLVLEVVTSVFDGTTACEKPLLPCLSFLFLSTFFVQCYSYHNGYPKPLSMTFCV